MAETMMKFDIEVDAATGKARLREFGDQAEKTGKQAQAADKQISGKEGLSGGFGNLGIAVGIFAASAAVVKAVDFFKDCAREGFRAEQQFRKLENAVRLTSAGGGVLVAALQKQAAELSRVSMLDDDTISGLQAMAIQMGIASSQATRLVRLAADLAATMGDGPEGAARAAEMLARSISSGTTRALVRAGIDVKEFTFRAGDAAKVLDVLEEKIGGRAAADMETYAGKINLAAKSWVNFKEAIGKFAQNPIFLKILTDTTDIIEKMTKGLNNLGEKPSAFAAIDAVKAAGLPTEWTESLLTLASQKGVFDEVNQKLIDAAKNLKPGDWNYWRGILKGISQDLHGGMAPALKENTEKAKTFADALHDIIKNYGTVEAQASRWWKTYGGGKKVEHLPTQRYEQVGMTPYAPPLSWDAIVPSIIASVEASEAYRSSLEQIQADMDNHLQTTLNNTYATQAWGEALSMVAQAFGAAGAAMLTAAIAGGKANVSFAAVARQLSQSCFGQALYETALAIAASTHWGAALYGNAAAHWKAAAVFAAAGAALGLIARAAGGGQTGASAGYQRTKAAKEAETTTTAARNIEVTVYLEGHGIITDPAAFSREIIEQTKRQMSKSGQN